MAGDSDDASISPMIILDGGNIIRCGKKVIMTDKVFQENPHLTREQLIKYLENRFEALITD